MDLDTRARSAAQGIRRAVEVMEMSTDTKEPRKVERFDQYRDRKNNNRKIGAIAVAAAVAAIVVIVAVSSTRTNNTQLGANPAINWPISAPGTGGFTVDLTTGKATLLPDAIAQNGDGGYAVSPDRTKVAFGINGSLYIANMDGTGSRAITSGRSNAMGPHWSPDGSMLVYQQRSWIRTRPRSGTSTSMTSGPVRTPG